MKRKIILTVFLAVFAILLISCKGVIENANFETDGYISIDGEKVVPDYVMKIDSNSISLAEYRYYYLNQKAELDGGDDSIWADYPEYISYLKDYVESTLTEVYSIRTLAKECGVEPDYEAVSEELSEYKKGMSSSEFKKGLAEFHLTEELYEYILQGYELYTSLFDYYFGENGTKTMTDKKLLEYVDNNYTHVKHILIYPNTTMTDEEYETHLNTVLEKAQNGEDFDALIKEYSNDTSMPSYGYYFTDSEMPEEFAVVSEDLEEGEISALVKSSYGYHIIKKLPVDENDLHALTDVVYNEMYTSIINDKIESANIEYCSEYEYISPNTLK